MNNYDEQPRRVVNADVGLNSFLTKMYGWMGLAVLLSAVSAYFFATSPALMSSFAGPSRWIILIVWFAFPFIVSGQALKRPALSFVLLMVYALITGAMFSGFALIYTGATITTAFVSSATVFIVMALYGTVTKRSLAKVGAQATAALIALIVAMVINMFLQSPMISYIFSFVGVIIFTALTASDSQKLKQLYLNSDGSGTASTGIAIIGAMQLYLDFVNLFLFLLEIFGGGNSRN
ncbi:Bax inhibitor-1/YccA family protein [Secundilactobacillus folii]|uniref:BAX inhibitor (BI)-1/YccA family protein n=1 Tax=Secundilactobacillus folii TaxID=2678357 RepID=A0A7X2XVV0_9LACO|nr:Bax inhibitor-1/YccA family protein [Secundilactobacillus folii]MTV82624.1 BAX inhibitor (BI)-1/YccA family protein [Secundilactobacillus folii]